MANKAFASANYPTSEQIREEITRLLKQIASPVEAGELPKACIRRASMRTGLTYGQTRRLWYGLVKDPSATITDRLRAKAAAHDRDVKASMYQAIVAMQSLDPALYRDCIAEMGDVLLTPSGESRKDGFKD